MHNGSCSIIILIATGTEIILFDCLDRKLVVDTETDSVLSLIALTRTVIPLPLLYFTRDFSCRRQMFAGSAKPLLTVRFFPETLLGGGKRSHG